MRFFKKCVSEKQVLVEHRYEYKAEECKNYKKIDIPSRFMGVGMCGQPVITIGTTQCKNAYYGICECRSRCNHIRKVHFENRDCTLPPDVKPKRLD